MTDLRFLIDTNIVIPMEPTSSTDIGVSSQDAIELHEACHRAGVGLFLHPAASLDLARDTNEERRRLNELHFKKYPILKDTPEISDQVKEVVGDAPRGTNDWVDHCLLEAALKRCVHYLVTEDRGLHRKARRLGLKSVVSIRDALGIVQRLFSRDVEPPPAVQDTFVYTLDAADPIFSSFRNDYPGFDAWLEKWAKAHRKAWVIRRDGRIAAFSIYKSEDGCEVGLEGKTLKLCSLKVAEPFQGLAYGELILRSAYAYAKENEFDWLYLTAFADKQQFLLNFLEDLGFEQLDARTDLGEVVLGKPVGWREGLPRPSDPVSFLRRYGPFSFERKGVNAFIVPVQPQYHQLLFPDAELQQELFPGRNYFGNSLRKAYLSNASIRALHAGDILFFYQSRGESTIQAVGVVEDRIVSRDSADIAAFVGKRTVYKFEEIEMMASGREVLAILFMAVKMTGASIELSKLVEKGALAAAPQSTHSIKKEHVPWLMNQLQL